MLKIVPEVRADANPDTMSPLRAAFRAEVERRLGDGDFASRETVALDLANEQVCAELKEALEEIVEKHGEEELLIDGECYRYHRSGSATYHSLTGPLRVSRPSFRKVGERNGRIVIPLDHEAGIVERATPMFAERVAMGTADGPSRDLVRQLTASRRVPPSRATLETMGKRLGAALHRRTRVIEATARLSEMLLSATVTLCLGLDRTTAPMEEDCPEGTPIPERKKPRVRSAPAPITVQYRMAYVGTMAFVDVYGAVLLTLKYAAAPEDGPEGILHSMMQDVRRALQQDGALNVVVIQDAAQEMWTRLVGALQDEPSVDHWEELVDHFHAMSHFWAAAEAMEANTYKTMEVWLDALCTDEDAVQHIAQELTDEVARGYLPKYRIAMEDELTFITNNGARMNYAAFRKAGFPIGSGPTEGACKSFFSIRCKRSGQRWRTRGLRSTLACRAHLLNDRFPIAMRTLRRYDYTSDIQPLTKCAA